VKASAFQESSALCSVSYLHRFICSLGRRMLTSSQKMPNQPRGGWNVKFSIWFSALCLSMLYKGLLLCKWIFKYAQFLSSGAFTSTTLVRPAYTVIITSREILWIGQVWCQVKGQAEETIWKYGRNCYCWWSLYRSRKQAGLVFSVKWIASGEEFIQFVVCS